MYARICILVSFVLALSACGSKEGPGAPAASGAGAKDPGMDMSKPYLTEKKVESVIAVLKEKPEFWESCKTWNPRAANAELEAVAKKHGFGSFQDLAASMGRVGTGIAQAAMQKAQEEMSKDPSMTPEMKKMMQDQMKTMIPAGEGLNESDLKLVQKYLDQLEAVSKQ